MAVFFPHADLLHGNFDDVLAPQLGASAVSGANKGIGYDLAGRPEAQIRFGSADGANDDSFSSRRQRGEPDYSSEATAARARADNQLLAAGAGMGCSMQRGDGIAMTAAMIA